MTVPSNDKSGTPGVQTDEFSDAERELIQRVIRARRDIRKFKSTPIPADALARMLEAAHAAPSVGFMQPWDFILIDSPEVRRRIKENFESVNAPEKNKPDTEPRRELYRSLKLEGILESPLNIAVTCNHRKNGEYILGRSTMPQTAVYSVCLAIENLWLAARVEGIGVGWVSIIDPESVSHLLGLPQGVELIAYLCVGYPEDFRVKPLLEEVGWRPREALSQHLFHNQWGAAGSLDHVSGVQSTARAF